MIFLYDVFYKLYFSIKRLARVFDSEWVRKISNTYVYYFALWCDRKFQKYLILHPMQNGLNTKQRSHKYIVSLTSFPGRINYVWMTIETLLRQSFKPDEIILWLAEDQFPEHEIPESLQRLQARGLTVRFCDDLKSHKKYYYSFQEYQHDNVILVDDDMWYPSDMIKRLVRLHKKYPKDIITSSAQVVGPEITSMPTEWPTVKAYKKYYHLKSIQAFTGSGSLFPPKWYKDEEIFNKTIITRAALTCDDLWLKAVSFKCGTKTSLIHPFRAFPVELFIPDNETLFSRNKPSGENLNNKAWTMLIEEFHLNV